MIDTPANQADPLRFTKDGHTETVAVQGLLAANDDPVLRAPALAPLAPLGILVQPRHIIHDDIVAGSLVPIGEETPVVLRQPQGRFRALASSLSRRTPASAAAPIAPVRPGSSRRGRRVSRR